MELFNKLISLLPEGRIVSVNVGLFYSAVVVEANGKQRCGLAATLANCEFEHARLPAVEEAGRLEQHSTLDLAKLVFSNSHTEASIGLATINALLPPVENSVDLAAEDYIARQGANCKVALIGHFPFVSRLKDQVKKLWVLELNPKEDDLPASAAPEIIPQADILAITATTLINHTFEGIFDLRKPDAKVLLLGPSTPLSTVMFEYGVHVLSGSIVEDPVTVLSLVRQGATFRQIRNHGVRLVTIEPEKKI
jgi:uncharacterized protein (DUF4213/DUF364 family)